MGNRLHLAFKRQVPTEQAQAYAERLGVTFFEVSPLCNFNITESFMELARTVLLRHGMDGLWRPSKGRRWLRPRGHALGTPCPSLGGGVRTRGRLHCGLALPAGPRGHFCMRAEVKAFVSDRWLQASVGRGWRVLGQRGTPPVTRDPWGSECSMRPSHQWFCGEHSTLGRIRCLLTVLRERSL